MDAEHLLGSLLAKAKRRAVAFDFFELLRFCKRFPDYSLHNRALIYAQQPRARVVAGRRRWEEAFGRRVKPGERPIRILVPSSGGFALAEVFELSQTTGKPFRETPAKSAPFEEASFEHLVGFARTLGVSVRFEARCPLEAGEIALHDAASSALALEIVLSANLRRAAQFATLAHELAHLLLGHLGASTPLGIRNRTHLPRNVQEIEAESVSFLVSSASSVETFSERYLAFTRPGYANLVGECQVISVAGRLQRAIDGVRSADPRAISRAA